MIDVRLTSAGDYWRAKYIDPSGKPRCPQLGPKSKMTKAEAKRKCREIAVKFAMNPGMAEAGKSPQLGPWLDRYLSLREADHLADGTMVNIRLTVLALKGFFGVDTRMDKITRARAADFRVEIAKRPKGNTGETVSVFTVIKFMSLAKQMFEKARKENAVTFNPFDEEKTNYPEVEKEWPYISDEVTEKIIAACPDLLWRCLFALSRWGGLRTGEAMRLEYPRIDWDRRIIRVIPLRGKKSTKQRYREVPMQPRLHDLLLEAYDAAPEGAKLVFQTDANMDETIKTARRIIEQAGVGECWAKPFHTLRKSCETDWLAKHPVLDVTNWLGNSPEVARKHYHRVKDESVRAVTQGKDELAEARAEIERLRKAIEQKEAKA